MSFAVDHCRVPARPEVAGELDIRIKTVEKQRQSMLQKRNIHDVAGLTRYAIGAGMVYHFTAMRRVIRSHGRDVEWLILVFPPLILLDLWDAFRFSKDQIRNSKMTFQTRSWTLVAPLELRPAT